MPQTNQTIIAPRMYGFIAVPSWLDQVMVGAPSQNGDGGKQSPGGGFEHGPSPGAPLQQSARGRERNYGCANVKRHEQSRAIEDEAQRRRAGKHWHL